MTRPNNFVLKHIYTRDAYAYGTRISRSIAVRVAIGLPCRKCTTSSSPDDAITYTFSYRYCRYKIYSHVQFCIDTHHAYDGLSRAIPIARNRKKRLISGHDRGQAPGAVHVGLPQAHHAIVARPRPTRTRALDRYCYTSSYMYNFV